MSPFHLKTQFTAKQWFLVLTTLFASLVWLFPDFWRQHWLTTLIFSLLVIVGFHDMLVSKHTILRLYPVVGHLRYFFESIRPEIQQYFVETNLNGRPISKEFRDLVYQRAKGNRDTRPFGTQFEVYRNGYEFVAHSLAPKPLNDEHFRVNFGNQQCRQPYQMSVLNISAMSFGALSKNAIMALNKGAKLGKFAHNTGEGGLSPYHQRYEGDLIWQIGTGYFGCRDKDGNFNALMFEQNAQRTQVKMIEIKLSQGAKPGHGGILPAVKLTEEIAAIRHVPMGQDVVSPPAHSAFNNPIGLLEFVAQLRELSGGKPVGFKLCIGKKHEFLAICKAMLETNIYPDFITIDGGEGGTGAAPIEFTNSVGMPLRDALHFVNNALIGCGLRQHVKLIAAGKAFSAFHMFRLFALGADTINSARAMMMALGCIQSRHCNNDKCPTGIATQDPKRFKALNVEEKAQRVARFHDEMIENLAELVAVAGLTHPDQIERSHVQHRKHNAEIIAYNELYPLLEANALVNEQNVPKNWQALWQTADSQQW